MATFNAGAIEATLDLDVDPFQRGIAWARGEGKKFAGETYRAKLDVDTGRIATKVNTARRALERAEGTYVARFEARGLAEAAAEAAGLQAALNGLDGDHEVNVNTDAAVAGIGNVRRGLRQLIPVLAMAATGLIPLTAAAVPALGLASNIALAAGAAGTLILAFQGVGGALKATNEAAINPTAENLEKARVAMAGLTPAAREFIGILQDLKKEGAEVQGAAANGFFPGLNRGLETVDLRNYVGLVYELSDVMGDLSGRTIAALGNDRWTQFFRFVKAEARPGIDSLGTSVGNLAGFFASLWQAFDPLNDDFSDWLVSSTGRLEAWADALPDDPKFAEFLAYVREQGPEVAAALGAIGGAVVDIVVAAAPLGGVVLDVLEATGEAISFIASQPFGDTIIMGAAALFTLNKALAITDGLLTRVGVKTAAGAGGGGGMFGGLTGRAGDLRKQIPTLREFGTVLYRAGQSAEHADEKTRAARASVREFGKSIAGGAAAAAGIAVIGTGLGDALGVTNTAMLATTGAMVGGVPGAVAGGLIGAFLDVRAASKGAKDSVKAFNDAVGNDVVALSQYQQAAKQLADDMAAYQTKTGRSEGGRITGVKDFARAAWTPAGFQQSADQLFGGYASSAGGKQASAAAAAQQDADRYADLLVQLATAQGGATKTTADLDVALQRAAPAMNALGITTQDMVDAAAHGYAARQALVDQLEAWQVKADSTAGRTAALGDAVSDLGNDALSASESSKAMGAALDALLSPALNAESATDAWHKSLQALEDTLKAGAGFKGFTENALANKEATRDYVTTSMERLTALAGVSTTTEGDMAKAVAATRREFIESGVAAGFSRKEITKRADALGLTPTMVRTVFEAAGIDKADLRARRLRETYRGLPKNVQTELKANGIPKTSADVDRLVAKYKLTEKQRQALLTIRDLATKDVNKVLERLGLVDRTHATPSITLAGASAAISNLASVGAMLSNIDGRVATSTVITNRLENKVPGRVRKALGGPVHGPGTGTSDSIPALLSNGEHVWTAREVLNAGGHAAVEAMRAQFRYAAGGAVRMDAPPRRAVSARQVAALTRSTAVTSPAGDIDRLVKAIEDNRGVYAHVTSKEDLEAAMRALEAELRRR